MYIVVILLGTSVGASTSAEAFLNMDTIKIVALGLVAFAFGTAGGVLFGKILCKVTKGKINPLIGSAGVGRTYGGTCFPEGWCRGRPDQLPADARDGTERSRCYRYGSCGRYFHGHLWRINEEV